MSEIIPRTNVNNRVELIDERSTKLDVISPLTPMDAALLGRALISCGAALSVPNRPAPNTIISDAQLPVLVWTTKTSEISGKPVLIFSISPGIDLTFELTLEGAKDLGNALIFAAQSQQPLAHRSGTVH